MSSPRSAIHTAEAPLDFIVVGAGMSGINCAYWLQSELPHVSFTVLEGRDNIGGTWDLFKYPGIRSDTNLRTYGFAWQPWPYSHAIAEGPLIIEYLRDCVSKHGIDRYIQYRHKVLSMKWSSKTQRWTLVVDHGGLLKEYTARFVYLGVGYYNYETPRQTTIPGIENFKGKVIHPQFWPEEYDYTGQKMVIIGSGATAVSILPALAKKASVTLVQRSPGYIMSTMNTLPNSWLPTAIERFWPNVMIDCRHLYYKYYPERARASILEAAAAQLPDSISVDPHFTPRYLVWKERLCYAPDGDFFKALHKPDTHVVTGHVRQITERTIEMEDGQVIEADAIVTATGIKMELGGKIDICVDGQPIEWKGSVIWNGMMVRDVPNMVFGFGYYNASWTIGIDNTIAVLLRLWKLMEGRGITVAVPRLPEKAAFEPVRFWPLESTYAKESECDMPIYGSTGLWRPKINPSIDYLHARWGDITTGLQFSS
ncbi:FAD/NAD(P)-binding domain-containing protein [Hypoxylon rubiginosum]|uniref:FAD/NAD(P)-binding domain-containing protein n=1 Tax=Hypoxylon rubiginosum TaxID=110542 RepID=A0ACC0DFK9_9PEZI|nr:FAD/NAD(P)-binding domain-containing protein [Hypoxylon rubiginosum]